MPKDAYLWVGKNGFCLIRVPGAKWRELGCTRGVAALLGTRLKRLTLYKIKLRASARGTWKKGWTRFEWRVVQDLDAISLYTYIDGAGVARSYDLWNRDYLHKWFADAEYFRVVKVRDYLGRTFTREIESEYGESYAT